MKKIKKIKFFLLSFICSLIFISTPVLADDEILIDNDFSIEEEIEEEQTQEEHIEDIEEVIEEEIEENIEEDYIDNFFIDDFSEEDYIDNYALSSNDLKVGDYVCYRGTTGTITYARIIACDTYLCFYEYGYINSTDSTYTATNKIVNQGNKTNLTSFFRSNTLLGYFSDSPNINLDGTGSSGGTSDNTDIIDKLDSVLNTFYILVFIICTILGFLLAYIFVKVLFKI